jgi:hypothetical protein
MKILLIIFCSLIAINVSGQTFTLDKFIEIPYPKSVARNDSIRSIANDFSVTIVQGKLQVSNYRYVKFKYEDIFPTGKLIPVGFGELGGAIYYRPNDATQKTFNIDGRLDSVRDVPFNKFELGLFAADPGKYKGSVKILSDVVSSVFKYKDSLYMVGRSMYSVDLKKNTFTTKRVLSFKDEGGFPDNILAAAPLGKEMLVATSYDFYIVDSSWKKKLIFDRLGWRGLYLNSIAVLDEHHIYLGMRGGFAKIDLTTKQIVYYKYKG